MARRHWVIVASPEHARRGLGEGFVMANHGKRAPLARMSHGDAVLIYSPTTTYPMGILFAPSPPRTDTADR
ncbi:MAG: hypothetical protein ACRDPB_10310 [Nocardioidaceae bacterium]